MVVTTQKDLWTNTATCVSPLYHMVLLTFLSAQPLEVKRGGNLSVAERITSVICQPAFIAGLGVAAWLVLMGFSGWLYSRHRRRKQLGHYTTSFAYTPAGEHESGPWLICLIRVFVKLLCRWAENITPDMPHDLDTLKVVISCTKKEIQRKKSFSL